MYPTSLKYLISGAPTNDFSLIRTMYTTMKHGTEATNAMGFNHIPFLFNMGLMKDALQIARTTL